VVDPLLGHAVSPPARVPPTDRLAAFGRGLDRSLVLLAGLSFAAQLIVGTMLPILPLFALQLGATPVMLGLMVSLSAVTSAAGQFLGGAVSDRLGARRLLPAGLAGYGAASAFTAVATSAPLVVALRGVSGLGSGVYLIGERLYIREVVDRARLAFANSLIQAAAAVGLIIGPLLGGVVADASDLRAPFVFATFSCAAVAAIALLLPSRRHPEAATGSATAAPVSISRAGLGILLLADFALVAGYGSFITTFAPFAVQDLRWTTTEIGLAFSLFGLGNVAGAPLLGAAADRFGRRRVGALATIPIVALAVALVLPTPGALIHLLALVARIGVAGFTASWYALLGIATGGPRGGRAFGAVTAVASLGIVVGALAAGQLWESIDIRAAMVVTVVAMALAGFALAAYPEAPRYAAGAPKAEPT
jgi:MFS transporter, DHA1 family, multidrug resistance protein